MSELLALDKGSSYLWEDKRDGRENILIIQGR